MGRGILTNLIVVCSASMAIADAGTKVRLSQLDMNAKSHTIVVAVIDTGLDLKLMNKSWVCNEGHKDFTGSGSVQDTHGHGTHISGLIDQYAKDFIFKNPQNFKDIDAINVGYCQIILKFYDPNKSIDNLKATVEAFQWAIDRKVDIINYSGGGTDYSKEEEIIVKKALDAGIIVVAAAGNNGQDIDEYKYYPAMHDSRIKVVGNIKEPDYVIVNTIVKTRVKVKGKFINKTVEKKVIQPKTRNMVSSSNKGKSVTYWEVGFNSLSRLPGMSYGYMTGTSQATAIKTGKIIREMLLK